MRASLRRVVLVLTVVSIPLLTSMPAYAQEVVRLQLRPTFVTPEPAVTRTPRTEVPYAAAARDARRAPQTSSAGTARFGWDVEFHTGGAWSHAGTGTTSMPAPGAGFLTFNGLQSRYVRSWYFGDGTAMINAHLASASIGPRITALDPVLNASAVRSGAFSPFGARVGRTLTAKLGVEFAFEMMDGLGFTDTASAAADATRSTFQTAFGARFAAFTTKSVTSNLTLTNGGNQMLTTGALTINLRKGGRVVPYIVAGGGVLFAVGDDATIALAGDYSFVSGSGTPYRQTDALSVRYAAGAAPVGLAGAGFNWYLTDRSGLRADFRAHFAGEPVTVVLNWNPATIVGAPTNTIAFSGSPALQISTATPSLSSLSLRQAEPDLEVSAGGMRQMMNFTIGYFYRFPTAPPAPRQSRPAAAAGSQLWESKRVWEVDVHGGALLGAQAYGGTALGTFPVGQAFTAQSGQPSRYASTWMFGDGAVLINQIAAGFQGIPVVDRISSLNPVLTGPSLDRSTGGSFGARVSRRLSSRLRAEFEVESASTSLAFTRTSINQFEATRASFAAIWNGIIATGGGVLFTSPNVSATSDVSAATTNWQTSYTGGIEFRLWQNNRVVTYATGGAGMVHRSATLPEATLTGKYQFLFIGTSPLSETDLVRVHYTVSQNAFVVTFGGGMKYFLSAKNGVRVDMRVYTRSNSLDTLVDGTPSNVPGSPAFSIPSTTNPALVFSNTPAVRGNLTGPAITSLVTFTGSGQQIQYSITAGYFFRF